MKRRERKRRKRREGRTTSIAEDEGIEIKGVDWDRAVEAWRLVFSVEIFLTFLYIAHLSGGSNPDYIIWGVTGAVLALLSYFSGGIVGLLVLGLLSAMLGTPVAVIMVVAVAVALAVSIVYVKYIRITISSSSQEVG